MWQDAVVAERPITDFVWSPEEIAVLAGAAFVPKKRGPYKRGREMR